MVLDGDSQQVVSFSRPGDSYFQDLEITNKSTEGVTFTSPLNVAGTFIYDPATNLDFPGVSSFGMTLLHDVSVTGALTVDGPLALAGKTLTVTGDLTVNSGDSLDVNGGSLNVGGNVTVNGTFDLSGTSLTIPGNLIINGLFDVNGGNVSIGGDLTISGGVANLQMVNTEDVVAVAGSALFYGGDTTLYLTAGTLKVGGNFTQQNYNAVYKNFLASGTHRVVLDGDSQQTVSFDSPGDSHFAYLEINNTSDEGVVFEPARQIFALDGLILTTTNFSGLDQSPSITSLLETTTWYRDLPNMYQLEAFDPDLLDPIFGEEIQFSVDAESAASGVIITNEGLLYWIPGMEQTGEYAITVIVTDKAGAQGKQTFIVNVTIPLFESPDNDSTVQSTPIPFASKMLKADLTLPEGGSGDVDFYKITLTENRQIKVSIITLGANTYLLEILDSQEMHLGTLELSGSSDWPLEKFVNVGLSAGNYFFKVSSADGVYDPAQTYGVQYTDIDAWQDVEETVQVVFGSEYKDVLLNSQDQRSYQFTLDQDGSVSVFYDNPVLSDYLFTLLNADQEIVECFHLLSGLDRNCKLNLAAGDYNLILETAGYVDASQEFSLSFSMLSPDESVESESNNVASLADTIEIAKPITGRIASDVDVDFYELTLSTPKVLDVTFNTAVSAPGSYELQVLIGENIINTISIAGSGNSDSLPLALFPGTYFLKVTGEGVSSADDYVIELTEVTGVDREFEPNNSKSFANGVLPGVEKQCRLHGSEDRDYFGITYSDFDYFGVFITPATMGVDFNVKVFNAENGLVLNFPVTGTETVYREMYLWPGNYFIEVTGTYAGEYTLRVEDFGYAGPLKNLVKLAIIDAPESLDVSDEISLSLVGSYTDGGAVDLSSSQAEWTSSDESVAIVNNSVVIALSSGTVTLFASYGGQMAKVDLSVGAGGLEHQQTRGNLILVAGGGVAATNTLKESTQYLSDLTYGRFQARGFETQDIYYFNPLPWHDINGDGYGDPVVSDDSPTVAELRWAIETWAAEQDSTGPLYLVFIDHGGIDTFEVFPGQVITASQLNDAISVFETTTGRQVVVLIEACKSGSFTDDLALAESNRMIITSTDEGNAYLELKGRISFTQFFMDRLYSGDTFRQSYLKTLDRLSNVGRPYSLMAPQLVEGVALTLSMERLGGNFAIAGLFPEITDQTGDLAIPAQTLQAFSVTVSDLSGQTTVWAVVKPPNYQVPVVVGDLESPDVSLPGFDLIDEESSVLDRVFTGSYGDFVYNGQYRIVFYARNADGLVTVSPPTLVTVTGGVDPVTADAGSNQTVPEGVAVTLNGSNSTGTIVSYGWVQTAGTSVVLSDAAADKPTFTVPEVGIGGESLTFELTVTDNNSATSSDTVTINISNVVLAGDINDSGDVDLTDAVLALQLVTQRTTATLVSAKADVNGDGKIGLEEMIYILQEISGLK